MTNAFDGSINKAAKLFLAFKALTRSITTSVVSVIVLCPGLNPDWFIFKIPCLDKKRAKLLIYQGFENLG